MNNTAQLLAAWAFFFFGLSALGYVAFRFLSLVISLEVGILKEFRGVQRVAQSGQATEAPTESGIKDFIRNRFTSSEGEFVPQSDEAQFIQEQVDHLRNQGLTEEELEAFVRQSVTDKTDTGK